MSPTPEEAKLEIEALMSRASQLAEKIRRLTPKHPAYYLVNQAWWKLKEALEFFKP